MEESESAFLEEKLNQQNNWFDTYSSSKPWAIKWPHWLQLLVEKNVFLTKGKLVFGGFVNNANVVPFPSFQIVIVSLLIKMKKECDS